MRKVDNHMLQVIRKTIFFLGIVMVISNCREPFGPDFKTGQNDFLVVEGFIHIGIKAVTEIKLSRVAPLEHTGQVFEPNAIIEIENEAGNRFLLHEKTLGIYRSDSLSLDPGDQYRLLITTQQGKHYTSNTTTVKETPAIDSVYWRMDHDQKINIKVDTHDDENKTHYYKWDYQETWELRSDFYSTYKYVPGSGMAIRNVVELFDMHRCWKSESLKGLEFASTIPLAEDRIQYPLISVSAYDVDERFDFFYTVRVEQRTLTKEEFEYLEIMEKNSTITGSLFDPMPTEIYGNLKSIDESGEYVVGFIGAYTTSAARIWIDATLLNLVVDKCEQIEVDEEGYETFFGPGGSYTPITIDTLRPGIVLGALRECMDCRINGGISVEPYFWIDK